MFVCRCTMSRAIMYVYIDKCVECVCVCVCRCTMSIAIMYVYIDNLCVCAHLAALKYRDLQVLAKYGIKAKMKSSEIVAQFLQTGCTNVTSTPEILVHPQFLKTISYPICSRAFWLCSSFSSHQESCKVCCWPWLRHNAFHRRAHIL